MNHPPIDKEGDDRSLMGEEGDLIPLKNLLLHLISKIDVEILASSYRYSPIWGYVSVVELSQHMGQNEVRSYIIIWSGKVEDDPLNVIWTYDDSIVL